MSWFTSKREARLWSWTFAVVVGIYSTLGLVRTLAWALEDRGMLDAFFFAPLFMILATVIILGLRRPLPSRAEIGIALGVLATYTLVFLRMAVPAERSHLIEYGVLAVFVYQALLERLSQGRPVPVPALLAILVTSALGVLDEAIQGLIPSRVFSPVDMLFNVLAAVMAVGATAALRWARRLRAPVPR